MDAVRYLYPGSSASAASTTEVNMPLPIRGNITNMYLAQTAGTGTNRLDYELRVNGSTPSPTLTVNPTSGGTSGSASGTISVSAGDTVSISVTPTGGTTPTNIVVVLVLSPT